MQIFDAGVLTYPRTPHLFGSCGTDDDKWLSESETLRLLAEESLIVEEKVDGTNVGIQFLANGEMILQSGRRLLVDGLHQQYDVFKHWVQVHRQDFDDHLQDRYILFGEWLFARHSIHYRQLSHYFLEFDIYDKFVGSFLDLRQRRQLILKLRVQTVPVLHTGPIDLQALRKMIGLSEFDARFEDSDSGQSDALMEGLYLRTESDGRVGGRGKFVRPEFIRSSRQCKDWMRQPIVPNLLKEGVDVWA